MRLTRSLIFILAVASAIGAAVIARKSVSQPSQQIVRIAPTTVELLVASRKIPAGKPIEGEDLRWLDWPENALPEGAVIRGTGMQAERFAGAYARYPLIAGEPVAEVKLIRPGKGSLVAALIEDGKRAVAVPVRDESAVGGLIQPHDRVDVLWSSNSERNGERDQAAQILLHGVKVLAVGKSVQSVVASANSSTATLELTPDQARILAGARIRGELSLALISATDRTAYSGPASANRLGKRQTTIRVMKFGHGPTEFSGRALR